MLLNLDPTFKPYGNGLDVKSWIFNAGEIGIKISQYTTKYLKFHLKDHKTIITARLINSDKIMELLMTTDALKRIGFKDIEAHIFYLPYARQDRVMVEGESLSLRVFADLINSQGYSRVVIFDQHSDVSTALLNNVVNISNHTFVRHVFRNNRVYKLAEKNNYWLCSSDAGSLKRIYKLAAFIEAENIIKCDKERDVSNGQILSTTVNKDNLNGWDCWIVDDICEKATTFIKIAEQLKQRNCGKIYLIVSHGIFPFGYNLNGIDGVWCTDSFKSNFDDPKITVVKLSEFLKLEQTYEG